jgi:pyruvate formate lyase activating enzyme
MHIDREKCDACGICEKICPTTALEIIGQKKTVDEIIKKALRDKVFYEKSNGGVTLSGGEAAIQHDVCIELLKRLRTNNIHTALDTCGFMPNDHFSMLIENADMILFDLKFIDPALHKKFTGVDNGLILQNAEWLGKSGRRFWVRTPVVPGYTDSEKNIKNIAKFIMEKMPTCEKYEILAYNNMCESKYERLDRHFLLKGQKLLTGHQMEQLKNIAIEEGLSCAVWSGVTRIEKDMD